MTAPPNATVDSRREFLKHAAASAVALPFVAGCSSPSAPPVGEGAPATATTPPAPPTGPPPKLQPIGSPVLDSLGPVLEASRHVRTDPAKVVEHAKWLAYEELPFPEFSLPYGLADDRERAIDFTMVGNCINTAFTDFATSVKFQTEFQGQTVSDSQAMTACLKRAMDAGTPILDGKYLARVTRSDLAKVFAGNIEMPMLDEKLQVLNDVGKVLEARYGGFFHNFVDTCSPRLYDNGRGLVDRLVTEFPRFNDVSNYHGHEVKIFKLAQLGYWGLYSGLKRKGGFPIEDIASMTAFADYIVPVALRVMDILVYSPELEQKINTHQLIARDSDEEIEIRAHMLYATALMREEINKRRPPELQIIIPQLDARLWLSYHTTHWPHHLTKTIMY